MSLNWTKEARIIRETKDKYDTMQSHPYRSRYATTRQKEYIYQLLDWLEEHNPDSMLLTFDDFQRPIIRRYDYLAVQASAVIRQLARETKSLGREQLYDKWYINLVRNKETGETKKVKSKRQSGCPQGYELVGTLKTVYVDLQGDKES